MKILSKEICYKIWEFVGKNAVYLNKELTTILRTMRNSYIERPITLYYRLAKCREKRYYNYNSKNISYVPRPSIRADKKIKIVKLNGNTPYGILKNDGFIIPSNEIYKKIIPSSVITELGFNRNLDEQYKIIYWEIFKIYCKKEDFKRVKLYEFLFPCKKLRSFI